MSVYKDENGLKSSTQTWKNEARESRESNTHRLRVQTCIRTTGHQSNSLTARISWCLTKLFFVKLGWGWRGRYCVCHKTKHIFRGGLLHLRIRLAAPRACTGSENKSFNLSLELSTAYHSCQEVKAIPLLTFTVQITWHWFKLRGYKWSYCSFRTVENTCIQVGMEIPRFGHF